MAEITLKDVENVEKLAKLKFSGEELTKFSEQFNKIVGFVEKISELDTGDVPPTTHAVEKKNVMRQDTVQGSFTVEEIAQVAPKSLEGSIVVPRVIEH